MAPSPESQTPQSEEIMNIAQAPHGINLVVETDDAVYIGRFDNTNGFEVLMHDAAVCESTRGNPEEFIQTTAKYGVPVQHRDLVFPSQGIRRVRRLGDIIK